MRIGPWRFVPGLIPTLAAAVAIALTLSLARWQANRAEEKAQRQALLEARMLEPVVKLPGPEAGAGSLRYRRVLAEGRYLVQGQVFIDNKQHQGRAGFHVITPLRLDAAASAVLVNRGWVARSSAYPRPPEVPVPEGRVSVEGLATEPPARVLELSGETVAGNVWQNLSIAKYSERTRIEVLPLVLLARHAAPGLAAVEEKPDTGIAKHHEYALTWLALALTVIGLWIALNLRRDP